jgi:hypothetical protein
VQARKGLALPHASHSGEIALAVSHRLRSKLAAAQSFSRLLPVQKLLLRCFCTPALKLVTAMLET